MSKATILFNEEQLRHPHDVYVKSLFGRIVVARSFFRCYLPPELVAELDLRSLTLDKETFVSEKLREYFSDLVYRVQHKDGGAAFLYLLLEHKSTPERWTPLQLLGYQHEIWERAKATCSNQLPLIVPVVLYHGERHWNVPLSFHELVAGADAMPWSKYVPSFSYHLCDLSRWLNEQLTGSPELRGGLLLLKNIFEQDMRAALKLIAEILGSNANRQNLLPMAVYLSATRDKADVEEFAQQVARYAPKLKGEVMETYAETLLKRGEQRGEQKWRSAEALSLTLSLLTSQLGELNTRTRSGIDRLSIEQLRRLALDSREFKKISDLTDWLRTHQPQS